MRFFSVVMLALCALVLVFTVLSRPAAAPSVDWAVRAGGPMNDAVAGRRVATLPDGGSVLAGTFVGTATFGAGEPGETTLHASGSAVSEYFLARYRGDGSLAWAERMLTSTGGATITDIAPDRNGVVIGGTFNAGTVVFTPDAASPATTFTLGATTAFFARFQEDGAFGSMVSLTGSYLELDTTSAGDVLVLTTSSSNILPARFNASNAFVWGKTISLPNTVYAHMSHIAAYSDGGGIVTSLLLPGTAYIDGAPLVSGATSGYQNFLLARINADGSLGWARSEGGPDGRIDYSPSMPSVIRALPDGGFYLYVNFYNKITFGVGTPTATALTSGYWGHVRYTADGNVVWAKSDLMRIDANCVVVHPAGGLIVSSYNKTPYYWIDLATGQFKWSQSVPTIGALGVDAAGHLLVAGSFSGTVDFGSAPSGIHPLTSAGGTDCYLAAFMPPSVSSDPTAPVAVDDFCRVASGQPAYGAVLTNDFDPNDTVLTAIKIGDPAHGTVSLSVSGGFTYTPNAGYSGPDSFQYQAFDGAMTSNTATVWLVVDGGYRTNIVSVDSNEVQGNGASTINAVSADGRYVAFASTASNLVETDLNAVSDIFVRDTVEGTTERVSVATGSLEADGPSLNPCISADGRYVAFESTATNLVDGDTNAASDIFLHDRQAGTTARVSLTDSGAEAVGASTNPGMNSDATRIAFRSTAANLTSSDVNGSTYADIFVRDRTAGNTLLASVSTSGVQGNANAESPAISGNGRFVTFTSSGILVDGDAGSYADVFVRDLQDSITTCVSVASDGTLGNSTSYESAISADGRYVAFRSSAQNLVPWKVYSSTDIYRHDRQTGTTSLVSLSSSGLQINATTSGTPAISADGRYVVFAASGASLTLPSSTIQHVYLRDCQAGITSRVSQANTSVPGNGTSQNPAISADGAFVTFSSVASNLATSDANGVEDVFRVAVTDALQLPAAAADSYVTQMNRPLVVDAPGVMDNDAGATGNGFWAQQTSQPEHGSVNLHGDGSFVYTPHADYLGSDSFTYRTVDGINSSNNVTVSINIDPAHAPIAQNDLFTTPINKTLAVAAPGVLGNDIDEDGNPLSAELVSAPAHGTLTLNGDGSLSYVPDHGYRGVDTFSYRAFDGGLYSSAATVRIAMYDTGGVATTGPWRMLHHDARHTGCSPARGPAAPTVAWQYAAGSATNQWFTGSAVGNGGTVYSVLSDIDMSDGALYAFGPDGAVAWTAPTGGMHWAASPAIGMDGTIYTPGADGTLRATRENGSAVWALPLGGGPLNAPIIGMDGTLYVGSATGTLSAVAPSGMLRWQYDTGSSLQWSAPAQSRDGTIVFGAENGTLYALKTDGTLRWTFDAGAPLVTAPVIDADGAIYVGTQLDGASPTGTLYAVGADGAMQWSRPIRLNDDPAFMPDGTLVMVSGADVVALYPDGRERWRVTTPQAQWAYGVSVDADGAVYVATDDGTLLALAPDGALRWTYDTGVAAEMIGPAIGDDGTLYLSVVGGTLTALGPGQGLPAPVRTVRLGSATALPGGTVTLPLELWAEGNENAVGCTVQFDPAVLSNPLVVLGADALSASMLTNPQQIAQGRIGIGVCLPLSPMQTFAPGWRQVAEITFTLASTPPPLTRLALIDLPVACEVADVNGIAMPCVWQGGEVLVNGAPTATNQAVTIPEDTPCPVVLACSDGNGDALSFTLGTPGHGTLTGTAPELIYTPDHNYVGTDSFTYTVSDGLASADAMVMITVTPTGWEADAAPRPDGNGLLSVADWTQVGRYAVGLDSAAAGSEFMRADCAPRSSLGDGQLTIADWVQAGRYAVALDPATAPGGPSSPGGSGAPALLSMAAPAPGGGTAKAPSKPPKGNASLSVQIVATTMTPGQTGTVTVQCIGGEAANAVGGTLRFDPSRLQFVGAQLASGVTDAALTVNATQAAQGMVAFGLMRPLPSTLPAGTASLLTLTFRVPATAPPGTTALAFCDALAQCEMVTPAAARLSATFADGTITIAKQKKSMK